MPHPAAIRILPGVASLHSVSKPTGFGGEGLRLTLLSQHFRSKNLRQIRRFMLPLVSLNLRQWQIGTSLSRSRSAETRRRVKTHEWSLTYPCLRVWSRPSNKHRERDARSEQTGLYPVASIDERRIAGLIDAGCLLFAYGAFLTLFGSLGGQFTFSKLSAAVCVTTFVIVYLQYFALFTVFGGTTPGMMLRGLQVVSFSGESPTPRQMLWRSVGYMLSAGTFFMGFLWAMWDEDALTWHDRLSQTYLCPARTFADIDVTHPAHSR